MVGCLLSALLSGLGLLALAPAAQAQAMTISQFQLSAGSVQVGGTPVTATVTVVDGSGTPVPGETVVISTNDPGTPPQTAQDPLNTGTYTASFASSHSAGQVTYTATDTTTAGVAPAQRTLTQTPGLAMNIAMLSLQPSTIRADGVSTSIATATVSDGFGNPVPGETAVTFASSDPTDNVSGTTDNGDGTYSATISSNTPGTAQISATDGALTTSNPMSLSEGGSTTSLAAYPSTVSTNAPVTLIASVAGTFGGSPSGTVTFYDGGAAIPGCTSVGLSPYATCGTTFSASSSPEQLTATFTPDSASSAAGSSGAAMVTVGSAGTSTSLDPSSVAPFAGGSVTYTASVAANSFGPSAPTGSVQFQDGGTTIGSCGSAPLTSVFHALIAVCTVHYSSPGRHNVVAVYSGDGNFSSSSSNSVPLAVLAIPPGGPRRIVTSAMEWNFYYTRMFTTVRSLVLSGASIGTEVVMTCHGAGCPFAKRTNAIVRGIRCTVSGKRRCGHSRGPINLTPMFHRHRIRAGTRITVEILRPGWIGKFYGFTIRPAQLPRIRISCIAPGASRPGVGC